MRDSLSSLRESRPQGGRPPTEQPAPSVSVRTLVLLLELFAAIVSLQYLLAARPARAGVVWLDGRYPSVALPAPADLPDGTTNG